MGELASLLRPVAELWHKSIFDTSFEYWRKVGIRCKDPDNLNALSIEIDLKSPSVCHASAFAYIRR